MPATCVGCVAQATHALPDFQQRGRLKTENRVAEYLRRVQARLPQTKPVKRNAA
ncbi:hypothetical protein [Kingella potus]|uniref:hypothetical protein n=1 Tax=Kingella potus TaxID=265175 RepID=UPI001FD0BF2D|nr:hypothetical protein [Kingella potus]UOP00060.1 hypothetical protein LVJ84_08665 [Kingella potus]